MTRSLGLSDTILSLKSTFDAFTQSVPFPPLPTADIINVEDIPQPLNNKYNYRESRYNLC